MTPFAVAAEVSLRRRWWLRGIASKPVANDVIVKLLAPKQSGVSLARDFHKRLTTRITVKTRRIRFVLGEERRRVALVGNLIFAELIVVNMCETVTFQCN